MHFHTFEPRVSPRSGSCSEPVPTRTARTPSRSTSHMASGWAAMNVFRGTLGIAVVQCRPSDPEAKGLVKGQRLPGDPIPPAAGWRVSTGLPRGHYVRSDANRVGAHLGRMLGRWIGDH